MLALPRLIRAVACASLSLLAACGTTDPSDPGHPGIRFVAIPSAPDTVEAQPVQALVAELRDDNGNPMPGVVVRFEAQPPDTASKRGSAAVCPLRFVRCDGSPSMIDTTDNLGRAQATLNLGTIPGTAAVLVIAPTLNKTDMARFTVLPGAAARVRVAYADTALDIGGTATLRATVVDRFNNPRAEVATLSTGNANAITFNAATGVISASQMGTQYVFARFGTLTDSTSVRVVPSGRLVVWSELSGAVQLVNLNGSNLRTVVAKAMSDGGVFPHFDASRQRITLLTGVLPSGFGGQATKVVVVDTAGVSSRDVVGSFVNASAARQLADGTLLIVAQKSVGEPNALFRVAADNSLTLLGLLPELEYQYGEADISPDGSRVAFLARTSATRELRMLTVATGVITKLAFNARTPRWSSQGDRIAFLVPLAGGNTSAGGTACIVNPNDGSIRVLGLPAFAPGIAWSPDGTYLIGSLTSVNAQGAAQTGLRLLRVTDGASVILRFRNALGVNEVYTQPDWR